MDKLVFDNLLKVCFVVYAVFRFSRLVGQEDFLGETNLKKIAIIVNSEIVLWSFKIFQNLTKSTLKKWYSYAAKELVQSYRELVSFYPKEYQCNTRHGNSSCNAFHGWTIYEKIINVSFIRFPMKENRSV